VATPKIDRDAMPLRLGCTRDLPAAVCNYYEIDRLEVGMHALRLQVDQHPPNAREERVLTAPLETGASAIGARRPDRTEGQHPPALLVGALTPLQAFERKVLGAIGHPTEQEEAQREETRRATRTATRSAGTSTAARGSAIRAALRIACGRAKALV
jgi:hypothetical protein